MRWNALLLGASLASSAIAANLPRSSIKSIISSVLCEADICLRAAVLANPVSSNAASASSNCGLFMTKVVTPCPVTTTSTISTTVTGPPITQTQTATVISYSTNVNFVTQTKVNSFTTSSTLTVTTVSTVTSTQTQTASVTVTSVSGSGHLQKREEDVMVQLEKRSTAAAQCTPFTSSATRIPGTFSTCGNTSRFSSACSCFGVTTGVKTIAAQTVTTIAMATQTFTPTVTTTLTVTVGNTTQTTSTAIQQISTTTTILVTSTVTSLATVQRTVTTTSTSTVILDPFPTTFVVQVGSNYNLGSAQYLVVASDEYSDNYGFTADPQIATVPKTSAQLWQIRNGNQLWTADGLTQTFTPVDGGVIIILPPGDTKSQVYYHVAAASLGAYDNNAGGLAFSLSNPQPNEANVFAQDPDGNLFYNYIKTSPYTDVPPLFAVAP